MDNAARGLIDWAVAARTLAGETESGDHCWVRQDATHAWVAVVDGVGHGSDAAHAARIAVATLEQFPGESPAEVFRRCHEQLRPTRGVVMSWAEFRLSDHSLTWLGVGNVEGVVLRRDSRGPSGREVLLARPGVLGSRLPSLSPAVLELGREDTLIFATDGVREGFGEGVNRRDPPQQIAAWILDQYGRENDDALVVVARYLHGKAHASIR